jgi:hypothetical protein
MHARAMIIAALLLSGLGTASGQESPAAGGSFQISGTAVNALGGQPVAHARISIVSTSDSPVLFRIGSSGDRSVLQTETSAADGRFTFRDVQPGKYSLVAECRGFYRQTLDAHDNFSTDVVVGAGKDSENIIFRLRPEAVIFGRVLDESGDPVREGTAMLFRKGVESGDREIRQRAQTRLDDQGAFTFGHLQEGTYYVGVNVRPWYAQHNSNFLQRGSGPQSTADPSNPAKENQDAKDAALDVAYPITFYPGVTDSDGAEAITIHSGDRFSADLSVHPVQALHLRVSDRAQVSFTQRIFGDIRIASNLQMNGGGPNGREIVGLAPGNYDIIVRNISQQEIANQAQQNPRGIGELMSFAPVARQKVTLAADGYLDTSDEPGTIAVSGTVKFDDPQSIPNRSSINFHNRETSSDIATGISKTGELQMLRLPPGKYMLNRMNAEGFAITSIAATGAKVTGRTVEIKGPGPVQLTISTSKGLGKVEGTVMRDDKPLGGAMVVFVPEDPVNDRPLFRRLQSDSDGSFSALRVLPGKYTLLAIENGWDLEWANPEALTPYMSKGEALEIKPLGKYKATLKVQ